MQHAAAGGRACSTPTSRWTPRTCCCASSSACSTPTSPRRTARVDPLAAARRRHVGHVPRRARRPVDDGRGLRRAAPGRRPRRRRRTSTRRPRSSTSSGGIERDPRLHPVLAGAVRRVVVGRPAGAAAGGDPAAALVPAEHLRLRLLGPPDDRAADRRRRPPPARAAAVRPRRAAHRAAAPSRRARRSCDRSGPVCDSTGCCTATSAGRSTGCGRAPCGAAERVDRRPPGGRRLVGRHPAAVGLLDDRPAAARLPARPPGDAGRASPGSTRFTRPRGRRPRRLEACQSPVWDTALAVIALRDAGVARRRPGARAGGRLAARRGDPRPPATGRCAGRDLAPGGWAFEFANDNYPDIDDTAEVVLALRRRASRRRPTGGDRGRRARRGDGWLGMQCRDGGWARVRRRQHPRAAAALPFCDFGEVIDPPQRRRHRPRRRDARRRARPDGPAMPARRRVAAGDAQEADGSWFGRWGANHVYGTGAVVPALVAAGVDADDRADPCGRVRWLDDAPERRRRLGRGPALLRRPGVDRARRVDRRRRRRGRCSRCSPPATAGRRSTAGSRGSSRTQRPDGTWDEPWFTGTGFPGDFYINYHLYRQVFPV